MKHFAHQIFAWTVLLFTVLAGTLISNAAVTFPYNPVTTFKADGWQGYSQNSNQATVTLDYQASQPIKVVRNKGCTCCTRVFSPALELKAGNRYTFSFTAGTINPTPAYNVTPYLMTAIYKGVMSSAAPESIVYTGSEVSNTRNVAKTSSFTFDPTENVTLYWMFDITTDATSALRNCILSNISITEVKLEKKPYAVENLAVEVVSKNDRLIRLSWTNPTHYLTGEDVELSSVKIARNGSPLTELTDESSLQPGATVTFDDQPAQPGEYSYTVTVVASGKESDPVSVATPYIGKPAAATVPHTFSFADVFWTISTADGANGWTLNNGAEISCLLDGYKPTSSSATTLEVTLDATKAYRVTYGAKCSIKANEFTYGLTVGNDEWTKILLAPEAPFMPASNGKYEPQTFIFSPTRSGNASLTFSADMQKLSSSYYSNTLTINAISIEEIPVVPVCATNLTATSEADGTLGVTLRWSNPTRTETGLEPGDMTVTILRDGTEIASVPATAATQTFTDNVEFGLTPGYHTYSVVVSNAAGHTDAAAPEATCSWVGAPTAMPYASNFADEACLYRSLNGGMTLTSAGKWTIKVNPKEVNDGLVAPLFAFEAGKVYELSLTTSSSSSYYDMAYDIVLAPRTGDFDPNNVVLSSTINAKTFTGRFAVMTSADCFPVIVFKPASSGYSANDYNIESFSIAEAPLLPAPPADLVASSKFTDGHVTVSWTMPDVTPEGAPLTEQLTASLYRGPEIADDSEPIYTQTAEPGTVCYFNDKEAAPGINTYTLVVSAAAGNCTSTIASDYHAEPQAMPFTADFTTETGRSQWTFLDESSSSYKGTTFDFNADNHIFISEGTSNNYKMNDWIVSPMFALNSKDVYVLTFEAKTSASASDYWRPAFNVYIGSAPTAAAMMEGIQIAEATKLSGDFVNYTLTFTTEGKHEEINTLDEAPAETTNRFIGMQFGLQQYCYPEVTVKSFALKGTKIPAGIDSIEAPESEVDIYTVTGIHMGRDINALAPGLYIIKSATSTYKYVKQ